ncbi:MAG: CHAT domain-containing protein [Acaryochloridaceae cyanobacterium SU_2_1]|nr:CHAT domain-containing protein [Acaryochloridaceae cyanobacterium SU_2_1]
MRDLGDAAALEQLVAQYRQLLTDEISPKNLAKLKALGYQLNQKILAPIRSLVGQQTHLLVAPDGALNTIPLEALVDGQGRYLIESYSFSYLTSGRDLLRLTLTPPQAQAPVIVANPNFQSADTPVATGSAVRGGADTPRSADFATISTETLEGTAQEAQALKALLPQAQVLTERQATEGRVKQLQAPQILHIATHGFFLSDQDLPLIKSDPLAALSNTPFQAASLQIENPLLRSGVVLAGAGQRQTQTTGDDGILTALEVTGLNLWGTQLVVLSACETGLGEVTNGDGIQGLRRALTLAGAQAQVISLWNVDDKATKDLMVDYYTRLIKQRQGRHQALRQAQLTMLKDKNRQHPYYWASFIASGDWRALSTR